MHKKSVCAALCSLTLASYVMIFPAPVVAGGPFATEWTQLLNYATLIKSLLQQSTAVATQFKQWSNEIKQGTLLPSLIWSPLSSDLTTLAANVKQGQGLAYTMANLDGQFRTAFPGYMTAGTPYYTQYANWNQINMDTIAGALKSLNIHAGQLTSESGLLNILHGLAGSAVGQNQALQVGTLIADQQVQQLDKMKQLMLTQIQTEATFQGRTIQLDTAKTNINQEAFAPATVKATN